MIRNRKNLKDLFELRDDTDHNEGMLSYKRYNIVMNLFAAYYGYPVDEVCSAFVALSPNSDYHGNLRSLASVLDGKNKGVPLEDITVSTYNACRNRAYSYLDGVVSFLDTVKGLKTRAFRDNILRHDRSPLVTVDGHMILAWVGVEGTMKDASRFMKNRSQYLTIAADITELAVAHDMAPCQMQGVLWHTRKRVLNIAYDAQLSLFRASDNANRVLCTPEEYLPYPTKTEKQKHVRL